MLGALVKWKYLINAFGVAFLSSDGGDQKNVGNFLLRCLEIRILNSAEADVDRILKV